jgi:phosphoglycerate dehydrogenase-like enzyme
MGSADFKSVGIIGAGRIGQAVARVVKAANTMGADLLASDPEEGRRPAGAVRLG